MKTTAIVVSSLALLVLVVIVIGYLLPPNHSASRERTYGASADTIFDLIVNAAAYPEWRSGVKRVEMLPPSQGRSSFRESGRDGDITYVVENVEPGRRLVNRIADARLPFGGSWTYELTPVVDGTRVRVTENGEVYNPLFRFMSRFVFGHHASIDRFMADLDRRLLASSDSPR